MENFEKGFNPKQKEDKAEKGSDIIKRRLRMVEEKFQKREGGKKNLGEFLSGMNMDADGKEILNEISKEVDADFLKEEARLDEIIEKYPDIIGMPDAELVKKFWELNEKMGKLETYKEEDRKKWDDLEKEREPFEFMIDFFEIPKR